MDKSLMLDMLQTEIVRAGLPPEIQEESFVYRTPRPDLNRDDLQLDTPWGSLKDFITEKDLEVHGPKIIEERVALMARMISEKRPPA